MTEREQQGGGMGREFEEGQQTDTGQGGGLGGGQGTDYGGGEGGAGDMGGGQGTDYGGGQESDRGGQGDWQREGEQNR